jgi:hypothetical protein
MIQSTFPGIDMERKPNRSINVVGLYIHNLDDVVTKPSTREDLGEYPENSLNAR